MRHLFKTLLAACVLLTAMSCRAATQQKACCGGDCADQKNKAVVVGAARTDVYVPLLKGKRIALMSNQTGMVGDRHVLDVMLDQGLDVVTIFSPEHGFRGTADAGEQQCRRENRHSHCLALRRQVAHARSRNDGQI